MRLLACLLPFAPGLWGSPAPVPSVPASSNQGVVVEQVDFSYYEVEGESPEALAAALSEHGPDFNGSRFFGMTRWSLSADYGWQRRGVGCGLENVRVEIDVETQLPYWRRSWTQDAGLRTDWYTFLGALDEHERGHRDLAREAADTVRRRLVALEAPTCAEVRERARRTAVEVMRTYDARHRAYDASTGHGHTQGAVWPREARHDTPLLASAR